MAALTPPQNGGAIYSGTRAVIDNTSFVNAVADSAVAWMSSQNFYSFAVVGGAVYTVSDMEVSGSSFDSCRARSSGGALFSLRSLTVTSSTFRNTTSGSFGGVGAVGNFAATPGDVVVIRVSVDGAAATLDGGAFYSENNIYVSESNFTATTAGRNGGAIFGYRLSDRGPVPGEVVVERSRFTSTRAVKSGGAVFSSGIRASVTDSVFTNTSAQVRETGQDAAAQDLAGTDCSPNPSLKQTSAHPNYWLLTSQIGGAVYGAKTVSATRSTFVATFADFVRARSPRLIRCSCVTMSQPSSSPLF